METQRGPRVMRLVVSWCAYWAALAAVTLGRFGFVAWRLSQMPEGRSSINFSASDHGVSISAIADAATVWAGSASWPLIALCVAGPPILLWVGWLTQRRRDGLAAAARDELIGAGTPDFSQVTRSRESQRQV